MNPNRQSSTDSRRLFQLPSSSLNRSPKREDRAVEIRFRDQKGGFRIRFDFGQGDDEAKDGGQRG